MTAVDTETAFEHDHLVADSADQLHSLILLSQSNGFELITVIQDTKDHWHAFLKRDRFDWLQHIKHTIDELSEGQDMLLNNNPDFVTSGRIDDLESIVSAILRHLEQKPTP